MKVSAACKNGTYNPEHVKAMLANLIAALTPDQATSSFNAWLGAAVAMVTGACLALTTVLPRIAAAEAQIKTLLGLHSDTAAALTTLALHTPVPPPPPDATAAIEANTAATQQNTAAVDAIPPRPLPLK